MAETGEAGRVGVDPVGWAVAALGLALQLGVNLSGGYGLFRDELYYLACADHLDWGYVDQPPLSIALLAGVRALFGDSLFAVRLLPALCGFALILLTGALTRELSGGRVATLLATLGALVAPVYLSVFGFYSMNAIDLALSAGFVLALVRLVRTGDRRLWLAVGVLAGLAFQNKLSILFLGLGLAVGLALTPFRRELASRWLWGGLALAVALALPNVLWQVAHGFPTLEFMGNAARLKNARVDPLSYFLGQIDLMHPVGALLWLPGLLFLLAGREMSRFRFLGVAWMTMFLVFALQNGKPYYQAPAYPALLAAGGVFFERLSARGSRRLVPAGLAGLLLLGGAVALPLVLPVLEPETLVRYARGLGISPGGEERDRPPRLGQHYADMFGWREMAETVARVHRGLPPREQARVTIFAQNYGQAAAIDHFGRALGLPRAVSGHNSYWFWGPGEGTGEVVIVIGGDEREYARLFDSCAAAAVIDHPYSRSFERNLPVHVCRGLHGSLSELWPRVKRFI